MYWTDAGRDVIERATMDGNSRMILHSSGLTNALGITLDYDNQVLYWVDRSLKRIESSAVNIMVLIDKFLGHLYETLGMLHFMEENYTGLILIMIAYIHILSQAHQHL